MLSPTPLSLFCALLLCLPLAIVFTRNTPTTTPSTTEPVDSDETPLLIYQPTTETPQSHFFRPIISQPPAPPQTPQEPPQEQPPPDEEKYVDDEDDLLLLKLASRVKSKPKSPKKIAFMFLTTTPLPFAPLWELYFRQPNINNDKNNKKYKNLFNIYIHADPRYNYTPPFRGVFAHRVIPSKPSKRHTPTLASAARRLLAHALVHDTSNSMFVLLSPSCIPIHSFRFTYDTLIASRKSFIEILAHEEWSYDRWAARGRDAMLPEVELEDFRIGSQFWALTRKHAKVVVSDRSIWPKFNQACVKWDTCYPEENYFPTLIHMRDPRGSVPATLTHVNWTACYDGHPQMYEADEVGPELISTLRNERPRYGDDGANGTDLFVTKRNDPFLFARKFHPGTARALLGMASNVLFKD